MVQLATLHIPLVTLCDLSCLAIGGKLLVFGGTLLTYGGILLVFGGILSVFGGDILIGGKDLLGARLSFYGGISNWGQDY